MENRQFFCFAILCLALCGVPSKSQYAKTFENSNVNRKWINENSNNSKLERTIGKIESTREIDDYEIGCSNYCVKEREGGTREPIKRVNVIWKILDDSRVTITRETSDIRDKSKTSTRQRDFSWEPIESSLDETSIFVDHDSKCEFYVELDCYYSKKFNGSAFGDDFSKRYEKKLVAINRTEGFIVKEFNVDKTTEELKILAWGKLSEATVEIPMSSRTGIFKNARTPIPTLSLSRTSDGKGVRLDARNPPTGVWRLRLLGVENSKYGFSVVAATANAISKYSNGFESSQAEIPRTNARSLATQFRANLRSTDVNDETNRPIKYDDQQMVVNEQTFEEQLANDPETLDYTSSEVDKTALKKSARQIDLDADVYDEPRVNDRIISDGLPHGGGAYENSQRAGNSDVEELSLYAGGIQTGLRRAVVDISPNSEFFAKPGIHDVVFIVTNIQAVSIRYSLKGRSSTFPVLGVLPANVMWIGSGETVQVAVRIQVPNIQDVSPTVVTLYVSSSEISEVAKKSTYVYVQDFNQVPTTDYDKPCIDYSFNDNCNGKLDRYRCNKSLWSVDVTVSDTNSGLRTVTSSPRGLESTSEFIAGTRNPVSFYYVSTCCYTTVSVRAVDVQGNVYTRTIDVTDWNNLTAGEIAAITLGVLLLILLIILIIILVIYCVRRRKSHDLSYSQRYGSRTPASAERSGF